jgi:predicted small lipoprotein YifL
MKNEELSRRRFMGLLAAAVLLGSGSFALAACGKKAPLAPPPNEPDEFGHQYPDPSQE